MNPVAEEKNLIVDRQGRSFRNLRISLTAACNYACTYCVPDGKRLQAAAYELGRIAQWRPNPAQHCLTRTSRSVNLPGRGSNRKQKSAPANRAEGAPRRLPRGRRSARLLTYPPAWVAERHNHEVGSGQENRKGPKA